MVEPNADQEDDEVAIDVGCETASLDLHGASPPPLILRSAWTRSADPRQRQRINPVRRPNIP
jgi:hypothetical protein